MRPKRHVIAALERYDHTRYMLQDSNRSMCHNASVVLFETAVRVVNCLPPDHDVSRVSVSLTVQHDHLLLIGSCAGPKHLDGVSSASVVEHAIEPCQFAATSCRLN